MSGVGPKSGRGGAGEGFAWQRVLGAVLVLTGVLAGIWWWGLRESAESLLREARGAESRNPHESEQLVERAIAAAGGHHPEGELYRALLMARQGRWVESLGGFSLIQHPERCRGEGLLELLERAIEGGQAQLAERVATVLRTHAEMRRDAAALRRLLAADAQIAPPEVVLDECERLAALDPADGFPWAVRARVEHRRGKLGGAVAAGRQALTRRLPDEEAVRTRLELVDRLLDRGELVEAETVLRPLLSGPDVSRDVLLRQAYLARQQGRVDAAAEVLERGFARGEAWPAGLYLRGIVRLDRGEERGAIEDLGEVVRSDPYRKEAHYKLGQALLRVGERAQGELHLGRSQALASAAAALLEGESRAAEQPTKALCERLAGLCRELGRYAEADRWEHRARMVP